MPSRSVIWQNLALRLGTNAIAIMNFCAITRFAIFMWVTLHTKLRWFLMTTFASANKHFCLRCLLTVCQKHAFFDGVLPLYFFYCAAVLLKEIEDDVGILKTTAILDAIINARLLVGHG